LKEIADGVTGQYVAFGDPIAGSARDILASAEEYDNESEDAPGGLEDILCDLVKAGPVPAIQATNEAKKHGFSASMIHRTRTRIGIESRKDSMTGGWVWFLPTGHEEFTKPPKISKNSLPAGLNSSDFLNSSAQPNADAETF
jgi:hypothetical protein